jgi:hypothetical protein
MVDFLNDWSARILRDKCELDVPDFGYIFKKGPKTDLQVYNIIKFSLRFQNSHRSEAILKKLSQKCPTHV